LLTFAGLFEQHALPDELPGGGVEEVNLRVGLEARLHLRGSNNEPLEVVKGVTRTSDTRGRTDIGRAK
jgi:hypothetical protein